MTKVTSWQEDYPFHHLLAQFPPVTSQREVPSIRETTVPQHLLLQAKITMQGVTVELGYSPLGVRAHSAAKSQPNMDSGKGMASTAPSSAFGTFSPAGKRGGEGSRC